MSSAIRKYGSRIPSGKSVTDVADNLKAASKTSTSIAERVFEQATYGIDPLRRGTMNNVPINEVSDLIRRGDLRGFTRALKMDNISVTSRENSAFAATVIDPPDFKIREFDDALLRNKR
ncbi:MAG: hypothetical protein MUO31_02670, partial [Thermodesulfovibrionales bacterium]|nr:hypothetical protein [Thermodesulfovibrionales bacterium]